MSSNAERRTDLDALWKRYRDKRTRADYDRLVEHYLPLVKVAAGRLAMHLPSFVSEEDLYSAGCTGLLSAVDNFDPGRDVRFETYATGRVRGAMLDELRGMDVLTRGVRDRAGRIRDAERELRDEGGELRPDVVAERAGMSVDELCETERALAAAAMSSLDDETDEDGHSAASLVVDQGAPEPLANLERDELLALVKEEMTEKDRLLVVLYYHEELTLKEIGAILGVSESRVSQMHTEMVKRLQYRVETAAKRHGSLKRRRRRAGGANDSPDQAKSGEWLA